MSDQLEDALNWARQFEHIRCDHAERREVFRGPRDYQQIIDACTVCGDERPTAMVRRMA